MRFFFGKLYCITSGRLSYQVDPYIQVMTQDNSLIPGNKLKLSREYPPPLHSGILLFCDSATAEPLSSSASRCAVSLTHSSHTHLQGILGYTGPVKAINCFLVVPGHGRRENFTSSCLYHTFSETIYAKIISSISFYKEF